MKSWFFITVFFYANFAFAGSLPRSIAKSLKSEQGFYQGAFDTSISASPLDDLNINPDPDADFHADPLIDIYIEFQLQDDIPFVAFYRDMAGPPIDLLGKYCNSAIGDLLDSEKEIGSGKESGDQYEIISLNFGFDPGRCWRNTPRNKPVELQLVFYKNLQSETTTLQVNIDKDWRRVYQLTGLNDKGDRVNVKVHPNSLGKNKRETRVYYLEDENGEYKTMRANTDQIKSISLPIFFGGYFGGNVTWWTASKLKLRVTSEDVLTQHVGIFQFVSK